MVWLSLDYRRFRGFLWGLALFFLLSVYLVGETLTLYSGRSRPLVEPVIRQFEAETGITVRVRYGGTAQLALALQEEGRRSRADLFWAQDAGALASLKQAGLLQNIPSRVLETVDSVFQDTEAQWVATSSRARVLAYSTNRVNQDELPQNLTELTDERWSGRVGWAPSNGSFQAFLSAWIRLDGIETVDDWIRAMQRLRPRAYPNNTSILEAIAAGEIDVGLTNHYYLHRFRNAQPDFPVNQIFFEPESPGNLLNHSAIGIIAASQKTEAASRFIEFLLGPSAQSHFSREVFEIPVDGKAKEYWEGLTPGEVKHFVPQIQPADFASLEETLALLRRRALL